MAEWSKASDSSSDPLTRAWVQIPLLTIIFIFLSFSSLLLLFFFLSYFSYLVYSF
ncbi:hypothetical protein BDA96_04G374500 [Sorghum bicolor]|uniref:Uncharacterized protein n=2 Tax=Sorghum bicolor TaxID=4558 RepID=A0A921ULG8_SORBI|nr:hypothetical protein BDA96_04G374500 [Sorghum bicolor]OQU85980.1 hypothetical protein SORBI_3004G349650 [Sorghum bicolor]